LPTQQRLELRPLFAYTHSHWKKIFLIADVPVRHTYFTIYVRIENKSKERKEQKEKKKKNQEKNILVPHLPYSPIVRTISIFTPKPSSRTDQQSKAEWNNRAEQRRIEKNREE
jgi:hypothetical protein